MASIRVIKTNLGFTLVELMVVTAIIGLLASIAIPNFIAYRNKGYCTHTEADASGIASAIANYFGTGSRTGLPTIDDLKLTLVNPTEISGEPNTLIIIKVTDRTHRCPMAYQNAHPMWDSNYIFTKEID